MRNELKKEEGKRKKFVATFVRLGKKTGYKGKSEETVLLKNITDPETNKVVTDHIWFSFTKGFQDAGLSEGMLVEFEARVKEYTKGYVNTLYRIDFQSSDYKLSHPTKIKALRNFR
jgi:hypothetical protein